MANRNEVQKKIKQMIENITFLKPEELAPDAHLTNDLGEDSITALELVVALETEFDIEINPDDIQKLTTLNNITDLIMKYIN